MSAEPQPQPPQRVGLFEMGSNSLKLYLVDTSDPDAAIETLKFPWSIAHRLFGEGSGIQETLHEIIAQIREAEAQAKLDLTQVLAVATGVFRELKETETLIQQIREETGVRVRVISGEDEAQLMARGFRDLATKGVTTVLLDLGGASTEWAQLADAQDPIFGSLALGAIRNHYALQHARSSSEDYLRESDAYCDKELASLPRPEGEVQVIATGGTAKALAELVGSDTIAAKELRKLIEQVQADGPPDTLKPNRQRVLLPGLAILSRILAHLGASELSHARAAVRHGMVRRLLKLLERAKLSELHATQLLRTVDGRSLLELELSEEFKAGAPVGRYQVIEKLGAGGMGVVYKAIDPELGRNVALKVMRVRGKKSDQLLGEAQALAKLSHPNVVAVHDVGKIDDCVFVAMEFIEGQTLSEWRRAKTRSPEEIVQVFLAAGSGLAAVHEGKLIQGDFKPDNVIVGNDGRVRLLDFGLARAASAVLTPASSRSGGESDPPRSAIQGTPAYMAPEQYLGGTIDERTDQFSFCVALWEALYGGLPFAGDTLDELKASVTGGRITEPSSSGIPTRVREAVRRGLALVPGDRHESMSALLAVLAPERRSSSRRTLPLVALAAALPILAVIGFRAMQAPQPETPCVGAGQYPEAIWDAETKAAVHEAFAASGRAHAEATYARVEKILDGQTAAWSEMRIEVCKAKRAALQPEQSIALREACLDRRLDEIRELTELFQKPSEVIVDDAVHRAFDLHAIEACADVEALTGAIAVSRPVPTGCGVPMGAPYNPIEIGRVWVYDVIDPSTRLPRNEDPKVITVEALESVGGCKGSTKAYRTKRTSGPGYNYRWIEVQTVDSPDGQPSGQITLRHRDSWFTNDGVMTKDDYYRPGRMWLDESCQHTLVGASFLDTYDEVEVTPGDGCGEPTDRDTKTHDWQVVAVDELVTLQMDYAHPACCPSGQDCRPPADGLGHSCTPSDGGKPTDWTCEFKTMQVRRREVGGSKSAIYWFAPGVGKVKEESKGEEFEDLVCFAFTSAESGNE